MFEFGLDRLPAESICFKRSRKPTTSAFHNQGNRLDHQLRKSTAIYPLGVEAGTFSGLGPALSRLRQAMDDSMVLGGLEREDQERNVTTELGLPLWVRPSMATCGVIMLLPHALLVLRQSPVNTTDVSTGVGGAVVCLCILFHSLFSSCSFCLIICLILFSSLLSSSSSVALVHCWLSIPYLSTTSLGVR